MLETIQKSKPTGIWVVFARSALYVCVRAVKTECLCVCVCVSKKDASWMKFPSRFNIDQLLNNLLCRLGLYVVTLWFPTQHFCQLELEIPNADSSFMMPWFILWSQSSGNVVFNVWGPLSDSISSRFQVLPQDAQCVYVIILSWCF